jgi:hypothetical protein
MGEWNLDPSAVYSQIRVIQIASSVPSESDPLSGIRFRTLVLSHVLSFHRIPAFFLDSSPLYAIPRHSQPVVIAFDIFDCFDQSLVPPWASATFWDWRPSDKFAEQISDHLLRAITLTAYYQFADFSPLYFTSFLMIPSSGSILEPFIYQKVPIVRNDALQLRTVCQGGLECILGPSRAPPPGTFILVSPHEHPLMVTSASEEEIHALTIDGQPFTFQTATVWVHLTRPAPLLHNFFPLAGAPREAAPPPPPPPREEAPLMAQLCHFTGLELFRFTSEDIERFFEEKNANQPQDEPPIEEDDVDTIVTNGGPSVTQILAEEVDDDTLRRAIHACLGRDCLPPPAPIELTVPPPPSSFFGQTGFFSDFGFGEMTPFPAGDRFETWSPIEYTRIDIPNVAVNRGGNVADMSAESLFEKWAEDRSESISGPKPAHFMAFFEEQLPQGDVETFMRQFAHLYSHFGLGQFIPFRRAEPFCAVPPELMGSCVRDFYKAQTMSEFQQSPIVSFVFGHPLFEPNLAVNGHIAFVSPQVLAGASEAEIGALAFDVYARIRIFDCDVSSRTMNPLKMKYQPPFLLRREGAQLILDLLSTADLRLVILSDDTGSLLSALPRLRESQDPFTATQRLLDRFRTDFSDDGNSYLGQITLTIFAEGVSRSLLDFLDAKFANGLQFFTIFPAPAVQARFSEEFTEDAIVFEQPEQMIEGERLVPATDSCYVVSQRHPAYKISIYRGGERKELAEYAQRMSGLSWLTARPGAEKRSLAFPSQLTAMIRHSNASVLVLSRFEFLPPSDIR